MITISRPPSPQPNDMELLMEALGERCAIKGCQAYGEGEAALAAAGVLYGVVAQSGTGSDAFLAHHRFRKGPDHSGIRVCLPYILPEGLAMSSEIERLAGYGQVILDSLPAKEGDVIIMHSVSRRNAVPPGRRLPPVFPTLSRNTCLSRSLVHLLVSLRKNGWNRSSTMSQRRGM